MSFSDIVVRIPVGAHCEQKFCFFFRNFVFDTLRVVCIGCFEIPFPVMHVSTFRASMPFKPILHTPTFLSPLPISLFFHPSKQTSPCSHRLSPPRHPRFRLLTCTRIVSSANLAPSHSTSSQIFAQIKSLIPLSQAFSDLTPPPTLIPTGPSSYKCCCPFHPDNTPSLHFSDEKQVFHCFGCNAGGTIIDFELQRTGDDSIANALRSLASRYPRIAPLLSSSPRAARTVQKENIIEKPVETAPSWEEHVKKVRLTKALLKIIAKVYQQTLWSAEGNRARHYMLHVRRFSEESLRIYGVGFAPGGFDFAISGLGRMGYSEEQIVDAGVAKRSEKGVVYDFFRDRVVTPIRDGKGYIVGMAGRVFLEADGMSKRLPKYVNSKDSAVFKKSELLFGEDIARKVMSLAKEDNEQFVLIVEGYMDVMMVFEHTGGKIACVATMGTAATSTQLDKAYDILTDPADGRVIINFDGDDAGIAAVERLCDSVIPMCKYASAIDIAVLPPDMKDPDEFLSAYGSGEEYISYLKEVALPWYEWRGRRFVIEEQAIRDMEEGGVPTEEIARRLEGSEIYKNREMVEIHPDGATFDSQFAEQIKELDDEMLVAFGAPLEILQKTREAKRHNRIMISKNVIEALARIVESAQRSIPGLNYSALVKSWVDPLTTSRMPLMTSLYSRILKRANELSAPWRDIAPVMQAKWNEASLLDATELQLLRKRRGRKGKMSRSSNGVPLKGDLDEFFSDPRRVRRSDEILKQQNEHLIPYLRAKTRREVQLLKISPRRSAEEIVLRALIFASELDRVEALEKLLAVMLHCQERDLPFWTSEAREALFEYLADVDGTVTPTEMAAELEGEEWWGVDMESLFVPAEEVSDQDWKILRTIEQEHPVEVVESTADTISGMAGRVASRLAVEETERLLGKALTLSEKKETEGLEHLLAKQVSLQSAVDRSKYLRPAESEEQARILQKEREEEIEGQEIETVLEQLRTTSVPYPSHFQEGEAYVPEED